MNQWRGIETDHFTEPEEWRLLLAIERLHREHPDTLGLPVEVEIDLEVA